MKDSTTCRDEHRRAAARGRKLNGLDYVEPRTLSAISVYFLGEAPAPDKLTPDHFRLERDDGNADLRVVDVKRCDRANEQLDDCLFLTLDCDADGLATYTLRLVKPRGGGGGGGGPGRGDVDARDEPVIGRFDPLLTRVSFTFHGVGGGGGATELDCAAGRACPPPAFAEPSVNYLAKDYASFRRLIFDRLSLIMPDWSRRFVPDVGVALVEVLAYVGDHLSYYQDAVATEAYLDTARERISVRRHARLVDYTLHEGCNARAWVVVSTNEPGPLTLAGDVAFAAGLAAVDDAPSPNAVQAAEAVKFDPALHVFFEPVREGGGGGGAVQLYEAHNEIRFYTWGGSRCCLERGATSATLTDAWVDEAAGPVPGQQQRQPKNKPGPRPSPSRALKLRCGQVLIFEEVKGPITGSDQDKDPTRRHAVRLTKVTPAVDPVFGDGPGQPVLEIEWAPEDALPFSLCLSSLDQDCKRVDGVSVARGNVVLVDHGYTRRERLGPVQEPSPRTAPCEGEGRPGEPSVGAARFRPALACGPLTHRAPLSGSAAVARQQTRVLESLLDELPRILEALERRAASNDLDDADRTFIANVFGELPAPEAAKRWPQLLADAVLALDRRAEVRRGAVPSVTPLLRLIRSALAHTRAGLPMREAAARTLAEIFIGVPQWDCLADLLHQVPASEALRHDPREALPCVRLNALPGNGDAAEAAAPAAVAKSAGAMPPCPPDHGPTFDAPARAGSPGARSEWLPRFHLLGTSPHDRAFVVETDDEGVAHLRFGDGTLGNAPAAGATFLATCRVGNGSAGNVGAGAINRIVVRGGERRCPGIRGVRNPLPAAGGADPEPVAEAKLLAPGRFRDEPMRAVTPDDYARFAERHPQVQRAAAQLRWTGGGYEVLVVLDRLGGAAAGDDLIAAVADRLAVVRRIGHDVRVEPARPVPLDVVLYVRVEPPHEWGHVKAALLEALGSAELPDGTVGLFHPDHFTIGQPVKASRIVAAAQAVTGVRAVRLGRLQRYGHPRDPTIERNGVLPIGPLEVARLDNNPRARWNGTLVVLPETGNE